MACSISLFIQNYEFVFAIVQIILVATWQFSCCKFILLILVTSVIFADWQKPFVSWCLCRRIAGKGSSAIYSGGWTLRSQDHESSTQALRFEAYELPKSSVPPKFPSTVSSSAELVPVPEPYYVAEVHQPAKSAITVSSSGSSELKLRLDGVKKNGVVLLSPLPLLLQAVILLKVTTGWLDMIQQAVQSRKYTMSLMIQGSSNLRFHQKNRNWPLLF